MTNQPQISIIISSHNRERQLARCIHQILGLIADSACCELIVVLDSCSDGSAAMLESFGGGIRARFVVERIEARNAGAARNRGASLAHGTVLLFLDDDVLASPELLLAHIDAQKTADVVVGYLRASLDQGVDWWRLGARIWWEDRFTAMRDPGYKMGYRDLFSGNFSIKASLFRSSGGFDTSCPRLEDYELGIRLQKASAIVVHDPAASATHIEHGNLRQWLRRARLEARAELYMATKHPEFRQSLFRERLQGQDPKITAWKERIRSLAFRRNLLLQAFVSLTGKLLPLVEAIKARQTWRHAMGTVHEYNYWDTIAEHFRTESEFSSWVGN